MSFNNSNAKSGLHLMFIAEIFRLLSLPFVWFAAIPIIGIIAMPINLIFSILIFIISIFGIVKLANVNTNYVIAFIASIAVSFMNTSGNSVVTVVAVLLNLLSICLIVNSTNDIVAYYGRMELVNKGNKIINLHIAYSILKILVLIFSRFGYIAFIMTAIGSMTYVVAYIWFLFYLRAASKVF